MIAVTTIEPTIDAMITGPITGLTAVINDASTVRTTAEISVNTEPNTAETGVTAIIIAAITGAIIVDIIAAITQDTVTLMAIAAPITATAPMDVIILPGNMHQITKAQLV
jgi:hypothetical protein